MSFLMWMVGTKPVLSKEHAYLDLQPLIYNALVLKENIYIKAEISTFHGASYFLHICGISKSSHLP